MKLPSDDRLALRAAAGDQRAFAAIFKRYGQALYRYSVSIVGNPEDAQDALQSTMAKALQALPGEERRIQIKPWLYRIAHNESVELLRRRRELDELDPDAVAGPRGPAEEAAQRERLGQLLRDLAELPERQRGALVMRELSGLEFEQIGEALGTTTAVARQTVYEARLSLHRLEEGREMDCDDVMRRVSDADGRVIRRREIQAHLRACRDCAAFLADIEARRHGLAAIAPLPAIAMAGFLQGVFGVSQASGIAGALGAGAGKTAATSVLAKSAATVAVVATIGVSTADRGGLVDTGLPPGDGEIAVEESSPGASGTVRAASPPGTSPDAVSPAPGQRVKRPGENAALAGRPQQASDGAGSQPSADARAPNAASPPDDLPAASHRGQAMAATHKRGAQSNVGEVRRGRDTPSRDSPQGRAVGQEKTPARPEAASRGNALSTPKDAPGKTPKDPGEKGKGAQTPPGGQSKAAVKAPPEPDPKGNDGKEAQGSP